MLPDHSGACLRWTRLEWEQPSDGNREKEPWAEILLVANRHHTKLELNVFLLNQSNRLYRPKIGNDYRILDRCLHKGQTKL